MRVPDAFFAEDQPDGTGRHFWVRAGGYVRHTLELQPANSGLEIVWITDSLPDSGAGFESRSSMSITESDARQMIRTLQQLVEN
ncbi:hypothetical protein [Streptomyces hundungensis]|uniref:hypothetical protein n=1 Tax=Streptomyces hundungensis TaxID=1077946 RepID=UPI0031EEC65B